ncbi:hypothetical protein EVAR_29358_1 [Eumeta japonica]|uniref:Uncharacterized protein n=1 Tax=Eumeta variegata TaxID=151549 RepID=A0A4C1WJU5_EUMVA|nr:hypothetical protein EVAR_29358_1 [Eumeta japonica]
MERSARKIFSRSNWWHIKKGPNLKHQKPTSLYEKIDGCYRNINANRSTRTVVAAGRVRRMLDFRKIEWIKHSFLAPSTVVRAREATGDQERRAEKRSTTTNRTAPKNQPGGTWNPAPPHSRLSVPGDKVRYRLSGCMRLLFRKNFVRIRARSSDRDFQCACAELFDI